MGPLLQNDSNIAVINYGGAEMNVDFLAEHEAGCAHLTRTLATTINETLSLMTEESGGTPSLNLVSVQFSIDLDDPIFRSLAGDVSYSRQVLVELTLEENEELMDYICHRVTSCRDPESTSVKHPVAFSAIDFPGSNGGRPRLSEAPHINALIAVPDSLRGCFRDLVLSQLSAPRIGLGARSVRTVEVQEIENSDVGVARAMDHILRFQRTPEASSLSEEIMGVFMAPSSAF